MVKHEHHPNAFFAKRILTKPTKEVCYMGGCGGSGIGSIGVILVLFILLVVIACSCD